MPRPPPPLPPYCCCVQVALLIYGLHPLKRWRYRHFPGELCRQAHAQPVAMPSHRQPRRACPLITGPFNWPFVGNLVEMLRDGQETACARWSRQHPGIWCFWLGGIPVVMTDEPELARRVGGKH